jgi:hypothetical protein
VTKSSVDGDQGVSINLEFSGTIANGQIELSYAPEYFFGILKRQTNEDITLLPQYTYRSVGFEESQKVKSSI